MSCRTKTSADKLMGKRPKKEKNVADNSSKSPTTSECAAGAHPFLCKHSENLCATADFLERTFLRHKIKSSDSWHLFKVPVKKRSRKRLSINCRRTGYPRGGEGTPRKIGWGCAARFPKPLPYLWPKSTIFLTLFMTWLLNQNLVFDQRYNNFLSSDQC